MRIFDGSSPRRDDEERGGNVSSGSGSDSGSTISAGGSAWSDSNITSSSTNHSSGKSRSRDGRRIRKRGRSRDQKRLLGANSVPLPNGVILTNGGHRGHHQVQNRDRLNNGFLPSTRSASASPRTGNGGVRKRNKDSKNLKKRGKKFPPSTPTPNIFSHTNSNKEDDDNLSPPGERQRAHTSISKALTLEDMELVDYEDLGSSSTSLSSDSENEKMDKKNDNFQSQEPQHNKSSHRFVSASGPQRNVNKNSSKMDYNKFNCGANNATPGANFGVRKDSEISNNLSINEFLIDDNAPCSSSSLRERLNSQRPNTNSSSLSKAASSKGSPERDHQMITLYEDSFVGSSRSNGERIPPGESLSKSESFSADNKKLQSPSDKYGYSGVGRHFGKKRAGSTSSLSGGDGESLIGGGGFAGESISAELLGYLMRLKAVTIVFLGTIFVLSVSSLLFVFPIVVDPILLGLEAQFSLNPVNCRTTNIRSGKGPSECSFPSCRAGCTADLFVCTFIDVEYSYYEDDSTLIHSTLPPISVPQPNDKNNSIINSNISESIQQLQSSDSNIMFTNSTTLITRQGTLFININGCGYPPGVNCTEFISKYGSIGREFMCFYSATNETIVLPYYNEDEERHALFIAILIPIAIAVFAALALFILIKSSTFCKSGSRSLTVSKSPSQLKLLDKGGGRGSGVSLGSGGVTGKSAKDVSKKWKKRQDKDKDNGVKKMNGVGGGHHEEFTIGDGPYMNGSVPKSNGHAFQNTISGLMGLVSPTEIHKTIKTLPHQHDSLDNGTPLHNHEMRRPRYVKKNEVNKGPSGTGSSMRALTQAPGDSPLFTVSTKDKRPQPQDKPAEHKL